MKLLGIVGAVAVAALVAWVLIIGYNRQEVADCMKLQQQSKDFAQFYLTQSEDDMCKAHGIVIAAPVK